MAVNELKVLKITIAKEINLKDHLFSQREELQLREQMRLLEVRKKGILWYSTTPGEQLDHLRIENNYLGPAMCKLIRLF